MRDSLAVGDVALESTVKSLKRKNWRVSGMSECAPDRAKRDCDDCERKWFLFRAIKSGSEDKKSYGIGSTARDTTPGCSGCGPSIDDEPNVLTRSAPYALAAAECGAFAGQRFGSSMWKSDGHST